MAKGNAVYQPAILRVFDGLSPWRYTRSIMTVIVRSKSPITVPDQVRRRAGFKPGDHVEFKVSRGVVTILTKRSASCPPDEAVTEAEAKKLRHALKQVREGKTTPWSRVKDELGL
jgi:bifunctional DNA-binding transcriptional regulator/antitoxin component of YhaV-PrlF toxin-antitoxin module